MEGKGGSMNDYVEPLIELKDLARGIEDDAMHGRMKDAVNKALKAESVAAELAKRLASQLRSA